MSTAGIANRHLMHGDATPLETQTLPFNCSPAQPARASEIGTRVKYFGDYELLEEVARGGMGVVYKARQVKLNRTVALKMILAGKFADESEVQRFQREAEAAANLDHPGIVPIFEIGQHEGQHYFSMGFVEGDSLAARVAESPLAPTDAAQLVHTIAEAVQFAHDRGVIHRDLKPANILLDRARQPRVTDFGLARRVEGNSELTATGQILGTPSYMAPEQASGKSEQVSPLTDVYALGAILYFLLTGRPPFQAPSTLETLRQVLETEPLAPRQLNPNVTLDLQTITLKCLEKSPDRRYASAQELSEELERFLRGEPVRARPINKLQRAWRWVRRRRSTVGLSVAVFVALLAVAGFAYLLNRPPSDPYTLTPELAKPLIAEAASISNNEWATVAANQQAPTPELLKNMSLSFVLLTLSASTEEDLHAQQDFQYLTPHPRPMDIARALSISQNKGYRSFIQPEYVTDCTVRTFGDTTYGTVAFKVESLYSGQVEYVARWKKNAWTVEEFHLPKYRIFLERRADGTWGNMIRAATTPTN